MLRDSCETGNKQTTVGCGGCDLIAKKHPAVWFLMGALCLQVGCTHIPPYESNADSGWKKSRVSLRKVALSFFHIPLYQLPDGYSSTYRQHLDAHDLSAVELAQRERANHVKLVSREEPAELETGIDANVAQPPDDAAAVTSDKDAD